MPLPDPELPSAAPPAALTLENEALSLTILPAIGAKSVSLRSRRTGVEWLLPPLRDYADSSQTGDFTGSDCGGFDECLPTVAPSGDAPDHGEVWRLPWQGGKHGESINLVVETIHPPLRFARMAALHGSSAIFQYSIENPQTTPAHFFWSSHPAFLVQEGDRVVLPSEVTHVRVEYSARGRIPGDACSWPEASIRTETPSTSAVSAPSMAVPRKSSSPDLCAAKAGARSTGPASGRESCSASILVCCRM